MNRAKLVLLVFIAIFSLAILNSCGRTDSKSPSEIDASSGKGKSQGTVVVDTAKAVEKLVTAGEGGELSLQSDNDVKIKVIFPQESLANDAALVMAPISSTHLDGKDLLVKGFSLEEKGTGQSPAMKSPALIIFSVTGTVPDEASVIKYHDDGEGYDVIPSRIISKDGKSMVAASVSGFSKYGIKLIPDQDKNRSGIETEDFNWVIYIKDKFSFTTGPMQQSITVDLKAVNTSGYIFGKYSGSISALTTNDMEAYGGKFTAPMKSNDPNLSFSVDIPVVPLVEPQKDGDVVPLTKPGDGPDLIGYGQINMTTGGTATGTVGGFSVSEDITNNSSVPFEIYIIGPRVRMMVKMPQGGMYFDGYIRGEGKK